MRPNIIVYVYINICRSSLLYSLLKLSSYIGSVIVYLVRKAREERNDQLSSIAINTATVDTQQQHSNNNQPTIMKLKSSRATNKQSQNQSNEPTEITEYSMQQHQQFNNHKQLNQGKQQNLAKTA